MRKKTSTPAAPADDLDEVPTVTAADLRRGVWRDKFRPVAIGPDAPATTRADWKGALIRKGGKVVGLVGGKATKNTPRPAKKRA